MPQKFVLSSSLIIIISALFISCEGPEGPAGPAGDTQIWVDASISSNYYWSSGTGATVVINNCQVIPCVMINDTVLNFLPGSSGDLIAGNLSFKHDNIDILPGDKASLSVEYIDEIGGECTIAGEVFLPGDFQIIDPSGILYGDDINFVWTSSEHADGYRVYLYRYVFYYDHDSQFSNFHYSNSIAISDTFVTFAAEDINPDTSLVASIYSSHADIQVTAFAGPNESDSTPNISGEGQGYFYGYSWDDKDYSGF